MTPITFRTRAEARKYISRAWGPYLGPRWLRPEAVRLFNVAANRGNSWVLVYNGQTLQENGFWA